MLAPEEATIPAIHAVHLAEVCAGYGVTSSQLFGGLGLSEAALSDPAESLSIAAVERLVTRARALTGEPALGILLGMQMRISAHGYLGFAAMVARTIGEALDIAVRYAPTRTSALALSLQLDVDRAALVIEPRTRFGAAEDVIVFALMEGIRQIGHALTGRALRGSAEVAFAEPAYFERFAKLEIAPKIRFGAREHRLLFARDVLDVPLVLADAAAFRLARAQCEAELSEARDRHRVSARVRSLLAKRGGLVRDQADIARALSLSLRTLKRRLSEEGTTFSELADDARKAEALRLVGRTDTALEVVAERLGYSDLANFSRAFRRWTETSPGSFRKASR